jgi:hypothetical protein
MMIIIMGPDCKRGAVWEEISGRGEGKGEDTGG